MSETATSPVPCNASNPDSISIREMKPADHPAVVGVVARGMRDNPLHRVAYGSDPAWRYRCHRMLAEGLLRARREIPALVAVDEEATVVGIAGWASPGECQPGVGEQLRLLPTIARIGPRTAARTARWIAHWAKCDPEHRHVHLGPVAVDAHLQGHGIGSVLMEAHCRRLDDASEAAYLETDKAENVRFYERFGYSVVREEPVLDVPNWFMTRAPMGPDGE